MGAAVIGKEPESTHLERPGRLSWGYESPFSARAIVCLRLDLIDSKVELLLDRPGSGREGAPPARRSLPLLRPMPEPPAKNLRVQTLCTLPGRVNRKPHACGVMLGIVARLRSYSSNHCACRCSCHPAFLPFGDRP